MVPSHPNPLSKAANFASSSSTCSFPTELEKDQNEINSKIKKSTDKQRIKSRSINISPTTNSPSNSSPPTLIVSPKSHRKNEDISHILSFEISGSHPSRSAFLGSGGSTVRRTTGKSSQKSKIKWTRENHIHVNFRFLTLHKFTEQQSFSSDTPLDWSLIESVIIPTATKPTCPICLDSPRAPKFTKCGHFFCWPCILRFSLMTAELSSSRGNWRVCPICNDEFNTKQLKSVHFYCLEDYNEMVQMSLVYCDPSDPLSQSIQVAADENKVECLNSMNDLVQFQKITTVSPSFIIDHVLEVEKKALLEALQNCEPGDEEAEFFEIALTLVHDRWDSLLVAATETENIAKTSELSKKPPLANMGKPTKQVYFHQSSDGQLLFLCPMNIKMLKSEYGDYEHFPTKINAKILEMESSIMTIEQRKRFRYLAHLPLGCQFGFLEVDLREYVDATVLSEFKSEVEQRSKNRQRKLKREQKRDARQAQRVDNHQFEHHFGQRNDSPGIPDLGLAIFGSLSLESRSPFQSSPTIGCEKKPPTTFASIAAVDPIEFAVESATIANPSKSKSGKKTKSFSKFVISSTTSKRNY